MFESTMEVFNYEMNKSTLLFVLLCVLLLGLPAQADVLNYGGYPAGLNDGHYYVGLANGSLASDPNDLFSMWCIDSLHEASKNQWLVDVLDITGAAASGYNGFTLADYQTMAVLGNEFTNHNPNDSQVQHGIWYLGDNRSLSTAEQGILTAARGEISNFDYSGISVFLPRETGGQMMMTGVTAPVPEPSSLFLLLSGAGLIGAARVTKKLTRNRNS